ncbi:MAG: nucleotidyltransferase family protein [Gammaproteobacteria bacterium HGW-Gammaproteobacteria-10]|nr:MAG: nucleotidyltransferase family protein [Gammaproteobacteria bacterium HGW-Gammaproteobacteria-10]
MTRDFENVYTVILAAGASRRLGSPKQLLEWRGRTLLDNTIENARSLLNERVIVILGSQAQTIQEKVDLSGVVAVVNPNWQTGIASSIRAGIDSLPVNADGVLMLLSDQPLVGYRAMQNLLTQWQIEPSHIAASQYQDTVGVPALFPSAFFGALRSLRGDRGAKSLLLQFEDKLQKIPLPEAELDIDTREDFDHLSGHYDAGE